MEDETTTWIGQLWAELAGEAAGSTVVLLALIGAVTAVLVLLLLLLFLRPELGRFLDRAAVVRWLGFEAVAYRRRGERGDSTGGRGPRKRTAPCGRTPGATEGGHIDRGRGRREGSGDGRGE